MTLTKGAVSGAVEAADIVSFRVNRTGGSVEATVEYRVDSEIRTASWTLGAQEKTDLLAFMPSAIAAIEAGIA